MIIATLTVIIGLGNLTNILLLALYITFNSFRVQSQIINFLLKLLAPSYSTFYFVRKKCVHSVETAYHVHVHVCLNTCIVKIK